MLTPTKNVSHTFQIECLSDLLKVAADLGETARILAKCNGSTITNAEVMFTDHIAIRLVEKALSDGSKVYDIDVLTGAAAINANAA